jgi:hypothetical protein
MAKRGVQGYGVPVDRLTGSAGPAGANGINGINGATGSAGATGASDSGAGQDGGFDFSQDPEKAALEYVINTWKVNPTQRIGGGGGGISASDALARRKYEDELQQQKRSLEAYQQMLLGGSYRSGQDRMMELLRGQAGTSTRNVEGLYGQAMGNISAGYGDAQRLQDAGYSALQQYLNQNPNNPYANVAVSAGPTQDDLSGLLGAYGVSADPVRAQVAAEGAAAQQGAAGFQNLLDVLGASAKQSDASRLAEMMMSQNYANTSLGSQRAGFQSQAARAQADALAQIQQQLAQSQMEQEQSAESSRQQIENAIAAAGGKLPTKKGDEEKGDEGTPPAAKQKPIDALKTRMETASPSLKKKIEKFVAENPKAGKKKIEQAFPKIASKMK